MCRLFALSVTCLFVGALVLMAQDDPPIQSGPKEGTFLPGPFDCYNFNGEAKGRFHCLVCRYALRPVVLVFAREREMGGEDEGKDKGAVLNALLKRLEDATTEFKKDELRAAVVFLSPDAQSAATNPTEADPAKLVEEAKKRDALYTRLAARAANFKNVDVAVFPAEGPKGYDINPKADVTVLFYYKMRVLMNRAYMAGAMREENIDQIIDRVRTTIDPPKKKAPPK